jgi:hypothetical protein
MLGLSQAGYARAAGVSKQAVGKARRNGAVIVGADGLVHLDHPQNAQWLETHRDGFDSRARPLSSHTGGRPARSHRRQDRDGCARCEPGFSDAEIDATMARLAGELKLDELMSNHDLDALLRQPPAPVRGAPGWDTASVGGLIDHVVSVISHFLERQDAALLALLEAFEKRLERVETLAAAGADRTGVMAAIERAGAQLAEGFGRGLAEVTAAVESLRVEGRDGLRRDEGIAELLKHQTASTVQLEGLSAGNQTQAAKLDDLRRLLATLVRTLADGFGSPPPAAMLPAEAFGLGRDGSDGR